ncbi:MAG: YggS family pyridoxal phosphate-dependent enzyme [Nitrospirae bacterium]|nr:YggS family pyridoxal phosphate-dependent enzyme [Nitrospirota bacterium]
MGIAEALRNVREEINDAAVKSRRVPEEIKLVAVSKAANPGMIAEAVRAGALIFGESRVQEAEKKVKSEELRVKSEKIEWHLIGHLQKNKVKHAVQLFDLIHSVDSAGLAEEVNRQAEKINKIQRILVEVKLSEEASKHGVAEKGLTALLVQIAGMDNLKPEGLMTIPPYFDDPEKTRLYFRRLRQLQDNLNALHITHYAFRELSMGMSNDFRVAIEEGSTMVRIGTAIFGERK